MLTLLADENMPMVDELFADFCWIERKAGRDICRADLADVDILLVRSITQVNQELLAQTPVKFVGTATIGTDHIDQEYLAASKIQFADAAGCNAQAVAEYVLAGIAYWANKHNVDLKSSPVGIIGAGNVGTKLSQLLELLRIPYVLNDPILQASGDPRQFVGLDEIKQCRVITCHVPLTHEGEFATYHLIDEAFLNKLQKGFLVINSARGAVLDNAVALDFLKQYEHVDFILDVWEHEPDLNIELLDKCLLATPHIAGYSLEGKLRGSYRLYQAIRNWLNKEISIKLETLLPRSKHWQPPSYLADLHDSLKPFYDIEEDHLSLAQVAQKDNVKLSQDFDLLRKNYKNRLEYYR